MAARTRVSWTVFTYADQIRRSEEDPPVWEVGLLARVLAIIRWTFKEFIKRNEAIYRWRPRQTDFRCRQVCAGNDVINAARQKTKRGKKSAALARNSGP